jgi:hypothetical protein
MRNWTLLIIFIGLFISCNQTSHNKVITASQVVKVDTSLFAIIPFEQINDWLFDKNYHSTSLTQSDILEIENLFNECIDKYNNKLSKDEMTSSSLNKIYKRQYVAALNKKGEKEVWINCFCETTEGDNWKKSIVMVMDGGSCYFNLKINLAKKKYYDLIVNGVV